MIAERCGQRKSAAQRDHVAEVQTQCWGRWLMDGIHRDCGFQAKENTGTGVSSKRKWILRRRETHSSSRNVHRSWALREGRESGPECPPLPLLLFHPLSFVDLSHSLPSTRLCVRCPRRAETTRSRLLLPSPLSTPIPNSQGRDLIAPAWLRWPLTQPAATWGHLG